MVLLCEFVLGQIENEWPVPTHDCGCAQYSSAWVVFWGSWVSDSYLGVFGGRASAGHRTRAVGGELLVRRTKEDGEGSCPCA